MGNDCSLLHDGHNSFKCRDVNGLVIMVQLKRNLFLGIAFVAPVPKPKIEEDLHAPHKGKKYSVH